MIRNIGGKTGEETKRVMKPVFLESFFISIIMKINFGQMTYFSFMMIKNYPHLQNKSIPLVDESNVKIASERKSVTLLLLLFYGEVECRIFFILDNQKKKGNKGFIFKAASRREYNSFVKRGI